MSATPISRPPTVVPDENPHYIRAVTELGDGQEVIVQEDIYASNGMKLLAKGAHVNQHQFERLSQHKLKTPLDFLLTTERAVDSAHLAAEASRILEQDLTLMRLAARAGGPQALKHGLAELQLGAPLSFRLTVMRDRRPALFQHSLRCTLITHALALRLGLAAGDQPPLLLAALCHDLGEMHTDPELLAQDHRILPQERRYIHVHPITSYVLLHELAGSPAAAQAVLHHHERLDGSGYPYGLRGLRINRLARLIAVADVFEAVMHRFDLQRLEMLLRMNQSRFDPTVVGILRDLLHATPHTPQQHEPEHDAARQLTHLADLLHTWHALRVLLERQVLLEPQAAPLAAAESPVGFLFERMAAIHSLVLQAGFDPHDIEAVLATAQEDHDILGELQAMLDEMDWWLLDLANEIERRAPALEARSQGALAELVSFLRQD